MVDKDTTQPPEKFGELRIPLHFIVVLAFLVLGLTVLYGVWVTARPVIAFSGAAIGVAAGIASAFYRGKAMRIDIKQRNHNLLVRDVIVRGEQIAKAFKFTERWNHPNFRYLRAKWRSLEEEISGKPQTEVCGILKGDKGKRTVAVDVLNFFEELAYSARSGQADILTLKKIFRTVVVRYFDTAFPWIKQHRVDKQQPLTFENLEWLANHWKADTE